MNPKFIEAREHVVKAREALRRGDKESARRLGEQAALLAPDMEDAWLVLAASDPNPQEALAYAQKALEVNPESARARKGVEWAVGQLKQAGVKKEAVPSPAKFEEKKINPPVQSKSKSRILILAASLGLLVCAVIGFAAWSAVTSPAFASIVTGGSSAPTQEVLWASVEVAKPIVAPLEVSVFAPQVADTPAPAPTSLPTDVPTLAPTVSPTPVPTDAPTLTPEATETPGTMAMEIIPDTPTSEYVPPPPADVSSAPQPSVARSGNGTRWIDVDLTTQSVYAYEGDVVVNSFVVSTGTWMTPTVTGQYKIYVKIFSGNMHGPGYFLPDVPYIMYFYKGYGLHGTYWHHNFGTPMSHGCVNLQTSDAEWLYNWASVGTVVNVHY